MRNTLATGENGTNKTPSRADISFFICFLSFLFVGSMTTQKAQKSKYYEGKYSHQNYGWKFKPRR